MVRDRSILTKLFHHHRNRDSSVGIAIGYGLEDGGVGFRVPVWEEFSILLVVQIVSEVLQISYLMGTGGFFHGGKAAGA
jgi:hypothetical protein